MRKCKSHVLQLKCWNLSMLVSDEREWERLRKIRVGGTCGFHVFLFMIHLLDKGLSSWTEGILRRLVPLKYAHDHKV